MEQAGRKKWQFRKFKHMFKYMRPSGSSVFNWNNPKRVKLIIRLRLGLSNLCQHKFKHSFQDSCNSICSCGNNIEMSTHFLIHFFNCRNWRLIHGMKNWWKHFTRMWFTRTETPLYGDSHPNDKIIFRIATKSTDVLLF